MDPIITGLAVLGIVAGLIMALKIRDARRKRFDVPPPF